MPNVKMVTRTIKSTECEVLCLNTETAEACNVSVSLAGTYEDEKAILKVINKRIAQGVISLEDGVVPVKVVHIDIKENLYGRPEDKFIEGAEILPPRASVNESEGE